MEPIKSFSDEMAIKYEDLGYWEFFTLSEHLNVWADKFKDRIALVERDRELSYKELDEKVNDLAFGFLNLGIKKGDNVVVQLPNSMSFVVTCFAMFRIGAVPVLSMPAHREAELQGIFEIAEPVAYIIPETYLGFDYVKMAEKLIKKNDSVKFLITDSMDEDIFIKNGFDSMPVKYDSPSHRDIALLLLSGGTTGRPKLIPRTHADYAYNAKASAKKCKIDDKSVYLAVLPIAHNFPLACPGILGTFFYGGKVILSRTTSHDEAFPLIEKEKVTITALVPAIINLWLQALEWDETDISSLKLLQVGGSPLDENLAKKIMPAVGCRLQQVFGMAEGLLCYTSPDDEDEIILSCQGKPLSSHDEIRIVDENGDDVKPGEYGELLVRGPYTISGYYRAEEQNLKDFTKDGFYRSGDKAGFTGKRNIVVKGRIKDQVNRAGEKIVAAEIESYLNSYPEIEDSALVPVPDSGLGERSCAFLISLNRDISLKEIHDYFRNLGIARYKMPDQIEFIEFWPLTSVGKVDKKKLSQIAKEKDTKEGTGYFELSLKHDGNPLYTGCQVIESGIFDDYLFYESRDEWSLGLGIDSLLTIDSETTKLKTKNKTHIFENNDLSETIERALSFIPYGNWRGYGTANFELSNYNYGVKGKKGEDELLKFFIPSAELRFLNDTILIRALKKNDLEKIKNVVESILNKNQEESIKTDLRARVAGRNAELSEINTHDSENYKKIVKSAVEEIQEPQYQKVILSRKIPLNREIDMMASYIAGRESNTPARSFILSIDNLKAAGFSPETVVEVDENKIVSTQPLAGTRSTGVNIEEEIKLKEELLNDSKEIAEHAISIKLAFEEMLLVCEKETIALSDFMAIARRGTVQHLASKLRGKLKKGKNSWHAFNALFPAVTATGIPKKESIDAIARYETEARNLYSGCVMTCDRSGKMDAALVLRSFFKKDEKSWLQAGAGIVDMSRPVRELEETCEKLRSVSDHLAYI